jgi:uncharacterized protein (TIGR00645 family)
MINITKARLAYWIFLSRWMQAPLYFGLILGLFAYVYRFFAELLLLVVHIGSFDNNQLMLSVLGLIDVVMIANLLIMVIIGGYETFVARLNLHGHPDHPEWLDEVNAGTMKIKLAIALIAISSIHLLSTFIDPAQQSTGTTMWQVIIHLTLVVSAVALVFINRYSMPPTAVKEKELIK